MYIGKDTKSRKDYLGSGTLLKKAIVKYGRESFEKIILADGIECPKKLAEEEIRFIKIFNADTSNNFYNISSGTESIGSDRMREIYQFSSDGKFIKKYESLESVCLEFGGAKGNLSSAAAGKRNFWKGYRWSYLNIPNEIIETKKGRKVGTKNSYKIERNHSNIVNVKIVCYQDGIFFRIFENRKETAEYFDTTPGSINQYIVSGKAYKKKYTFERGEQIKKTTYKN
jgi:hypothetical protein